MTATDKVRNLVLFPLTTREMHNEIEAARYMKLAQACECLSIRRDRSMHERSVAASRADLYYKISVLLTDLDLVNKAAALNVSAGTATASGAGHPDGDGTLNPGAARGKAELDRIIETLSAQTMAKARRLERQGITVRPESPRAVQLTYPGRKPAIVRITQR